MTVAPMTGSFIQAKGYTRGRKKDVVYLGVHTAEGSLTVESLGGYFAGTTKGSSNAGMGQEGQYAEFVTYNNTPWTNPPINSSSDTLEICGFSKWTREEWLSKPLLLDGVAHWIAWRCAVRGIPIVHRAKGDTASGVYGHKDINDAWGKSSHTDPGPNFPWDVVMEKAAHYGDVPPAPLPAPRKENKKMYLAVSPKGTYALFTGDQLVSLNTSEVQTLDFMGLEVRHCNDVQWQDLNNIVKKVND